MDSEFIKAALLGSGSIKYLLPLFLYLCLEEGGIGIPLVADGLLLWAGYQVAQGDMRPALLGLLFVAASLVGSSWVYWSARFVGRPLIGWMVKHLSRSLTVDTISDNLKRRGFLAILIGRLIPGLLVPTNFGAGALGFSYPMFAIAVTLSATIWVLAYGGIGFLGGKGISLLPEPFATNSLVFILLLPLIAVPLILAPIVIKKYGTKFLAGSPSQQTRERTHVP